MICTSAAHVERLRRRVEADIAAGRHGSGGVFVEALLVGDLIDVAARVHLAKEG